MRLNQVTMPMLDYAASVAFYTTLGLKLIVASPPRYARFERPSTDAGEPATLSVEMVEGWMGGAWPDVFFEVDDLDTTLARLRTAGLVVGAPVDQSWLWREAEVYDPAGSRIKLYTAGANRRFPPWRVET
jgi:catechol 2,3-dioxygenase-like lactoylglutathione lyase family enzyme